MLFPFLLITAQDSAAATASAAEDDPIVVTASRLPQEQDETAASTTVVDRRTIERLGEPLLYSLLRLTPSAAVQTSGPLGSFSEVRIRGAEANHTLLFIDGIRANDPAANDTPRFELLNADVASRLEVVRGPQSALWGSDAIGGVIAVNGLAPSDDGYSANAEAGSFGFRRAGGSVSLARGTTSLAGAVGWQRASGIDSFSGDGEKDGYRNLAGRLRGSWAFAPGFELGAAAFSLSGRSEFDGFDPFTFQRGDTLDNSKNQLSAARLWLSGGDPDKGLSGTVGGSLLGSSNRNLLAEEEINRTRGRRLNATGQLAYAFATGDIRHQALIALEHEREEFGARDTIYGGFSNQDQRRKHQAITGEWRAELAPVTLDLALRRDAFSKFKDATTVRASALVALGEGFAIAGSYAEGIKQPTFFDLFGFFPGSFVGNPNLRAESSRGIEASLRYRRGAVSGALTGYRQRLRDEIVDVFDSSTFLSSTVNRDGRSRRSGLEAELGWSVSEALRLHAHYAFLDADEPGASGSLQQREVRRPKHSGSLALDGALRRITYGASLAFVGARTDTNFDVFPAQRAKLDGYWLASARAAYEVRPGVELFARASNLFDTRYQDVVGYRTEGRGLFGGISLRAGRRSSP